MINIENLRDLIIYKSQNNQNVWLNIESLTKLFKIDRTGITRHINNIYKDEELYEESICAKIAHVGIAKS